MPTLAQGRAFLLIRCAFRGSRDLYLQNVNVLRGAPMIAVTAPIIAERAAALIEGKA